MADTFSIIQLSDLHVRSGGEPVLQRSREIAAAAADAIPPGVTDVVLLLSGDAAFGGEKPQFEATLSFVSQIEHALRKRRPSLALHKLVVPGNHDCDFSQPQGARESVLKSLLARKVPDASELEVLLRPQAAYFDFAASLTADAAHRADEPFLREVELTLAGARIRFLLLNSAWTCRRRDQQGTLHFPAELLQRGGVPGTAPQMTIAILHHPLHWFEQQTMRELDQSLRERAEIVFTGHEHVAGSFAKATLAGPVSAYVEGGVLNEHDGPECTFNVVNVDVKPNLFGWMMSICRFEWTDDDGGFFERAPCDERPIRQIGDRQSFSFSPTFVERLEDPGQVIRHPNRTEALTLSDLFEYPDLYKVVEFRRKPESQIRGEQVVDRLLATERVLVSGGEKCGLTSLAKRMIVEARQAGFVPLLLDARDVRGKKVKAVLEHLRGSIRDQYGDVEPDAYLQLEPARKVLVIDDVHLLGNNPRQRVEILSHFGDAFGHVLAFGNDAACLEELRAGESGLRSFEHYSLVGFGEVLRERLIRRWVRLANDVADEQMEIEVHHLRQAINSVLRQHLLPTYPLFLIVALQHATLGKPAAQGGSFLKMYEALMIGRLSQAEVRDLTIDDLSLYLGALADHLRGLQTAQLTEAEARSWHRAYWDDIDADVDFERLTGELSRIGILSADNLRIGFRYRFDYCYFAAAHLASNLHDEAVYALVPELCRRLHHQETSDIVLFLAHMSKDPRIGGALVAAANGLLKSRHAAKLTKEEVQRFNKLRVLASVELPEGRPEDNRQAELEREDRARPLDPAAASGSELTPAIDPDEVDDFTRDLLELQASFKTVQIIGQCARNSAGGRPGDQKRALLTASFLLSRRIIGFVLEGLDEEVLESLREEWAEILKKDRPELTDQEIGLKVDERVLALTQFLVFVVARHLSASSAAELLRATFARIAKGEAVPINQIFRLAMELERPGKFPADDAIELFEDQAGNMFNQTLIRLLVRHHLYLFGVPEDRRQKVCQKLDITPTKRMLLPDRKRLA